MPLHRSFNFRCIQAVLGALVTGAFIQAMANTPQTPTLDGPQYLADFVLVKSEFVDDPRFGKDPFYPTSQRRFGPRYTPTQVIQPDAPITELVVKGISGTRNHPLPIINNRTFSVGETAEMKVNGQIVKVQCVEVTDKVVKVTVNGMPKDLPRPQR